MEITEPTEIVSIQALLSIYIAADMVLIALVNQQCTGEALSPPFVEFLCLLFIWN